MNRNLLEVLLEMKNENYWRNRKTGHPPIRINETGEVLRTYKEVAERIEGNKGCIYLCLAGMRYQHKGYTFTFVNR